MFDNLIEQIVTSDYEMFYLIIKLSLSGAMQHAI